MRKGMDVKEREGLGVGAAGGAMSRSRSRGRTRQKIAASDCFAATTGKGMRCLSVLIVCVWVCVRWCEWED